MNYFVNKRGLELGPYDEDGLRAMVERGFLSHQDMDREADGQMWCSLRVVLDLPPPPPSPPAPETRLGRRPVQDAKYDEDDRFYVDPTKIKGVEGWLLVFCASLVFVVPLFTIFRLVQLLARAQPPGTTAATYVELAVL